MIVACRTERWADGHGYMRNERGLSKVMEVFEVGRCR